METSLNSSSLVIFFLSTIETFTFVDVLSDLCMYNFLNEKTRL